MHDLEFYVYIITNKRNGTLYIGHTDELGARMGQHIQGAFEGFAKDNNLKHLVWYESFQTRDEAFRTERRMKAWRRIWKLNLIEKTNPHWIDIYKSPQWPLPDKTEYPELWGRCMSHRIDPSFTVLDR